MHSSRAGADSPASARLFLRVTEFNHAATWRGVICLSLLSVCAVGLSAAADRGGGSPNALVSATFLL